MEGRALIKHPVGVFSEGACLPRERFTRPAMTEAESADRPEGASVGSERRGVKTVSEPESR